MFVDILGIPTNAKTLSVTGTSARVLITDGIKKLSIKSVGADCFYRVTNSAGVALLTDHYITNGERLDIMLHTGEGIYIAAISAGTSTIYITELA